VPPHAPTSVWNESFRNATPQLGTCNRSFLRTENLSTVNQFLLPLRTPNLLRPTTVSHKPRSRIKSGMTTLDYRDNLAFRHSELVSESRLFLLVTLSFSSNTENRSTINQFLFTLTKPPPAATDHGFSKNQIPKQVRDDSPFRHSCIILAIIWFVQLLKRMISILGKIDP